MSAGLRFPSEDQQWVTKLSRFGPVFAKASDNNKGPILEVLKHYLGGNDIIPDKPGQQPLEILEISSGSGQHIAHFFEAFASIRSCIWQPSDCTDSSFSSIYHYASQACKNLLGRASQPGRGLSFKSCVLQPVVIDASIQPWVVDPSNMSYWEEPMKGIAAPLGSESRSSQDDQDRLATLGGDDQYHFDAVFNANMIHITPYKCCEGLFLGVGKVGCLGTTSILYFTCEFCSVG